MRAILVLGALMLIGVLLVLSWLILLIRYPLKALPISMAALAGLALVASWVLWQENRDARYLAHLELRLRYDPQQCPADRPKGLADPAGGRGFADGAHLTASPGCRRRSRSGRRSGGGRPMA